MNLFMCGERVDDDEEMVMESRELFSCGGRANVDVVRWKK